MRAVRIMTPETRRRGDGRVASVTLFRCTVIAITAIITWSALWTHRELRPRDTLAHLVPANVSAYVHLRSRHPDVMSEGYALFALPDGLRPHEVAAFRRADAEGIERWSIIAAWDDSARITADERRIIADTWVSWVDGRTLVIPDVPRDDVPNLLAQRAHSSADTHSWLSVDEAVMLSVADGAVGVGLRQMRSIAPLQGYMSSVAADASIDLAAHTHTTVDVGDAMDAGAVAVSSTTHALDALLPPVAGTFGIIIGHQSARAAIILPLHTLRPELPLLGFGIHDSMRTLNATHADATPVILADTTFIHHRTDGEAVVPGMLFDDLLAAARAYGAPAYGPTLERATAELADLLRPPFTLSIGADGATLLHLPKTSMERVLIAFTAVSEAVFPATRELVLPDGTTVREYIAVGPTESDSSPILGNPSTLQYLPTTSSDGSGGTTITNANPIISQHLTPIQASPGPCRFANENATEYLHSTGGLLGTPSLFLYRLSEKVFIACG